MKITRYALGFVLAIAIWLASMCIAFTARSSRRAWLACLTLTATLAGAVFGIPH